MSLSLQTSALLSVYIQPYCRAQCVLQSTWHSHKHKSQPQSQYNTPLPLLQEALRSFQESTWQTRTLKAAAHSPISASCSRSAEELILLEESRDWSKQANNHARARAHTHTPPKRTETYTHLKTPELLFKLAVTRRARSLFRFLAARGSRGPPISARRRRRGPETHLRSVRWRYKPPSVQVTNIQTSSNYRGLAGALRMLRAQGFPTATLRKIKGKIY